MAEDKKSFVLYADIANTFKELTDQEAGVLFKHILSYVNDENPTLEDRLLKIAFEPIKLQLKRDLAKYKDKKKQWSEAGKRSAEAKRLSKDVEQKTTELTNVDLRSTKSTVNDSVNDNVSVNVTVTTDVEEKETDSDEFLKAGKEYLDSIKNQDCQKEKSCAKKENSNQEYSEILKSSESAGWLETVSMQQKKPPEIIKQSLDDFVLYLASVDKQHKSKRDFLEHFINWISKKIEKPPQNGKFNNTSTTKQQYKFSADRVIKANAGKT